MLTPLKEAAYFARHHARALLTIAITLSIPSWIIHYGSPAAVEGEANHALLLSQLLIAAIGIIQFAAAMLYIHHQVQARPISPTKAITLAASRAGPLLLINLLMGLAVATGLVLLILPGLFIAYKLLFAEFYLLFQQQGVMQSLRSSYRDNSLLADKLLPPLLSWGGCALMLSILHRQLLSPDEFNLPINMLFEGLSLLITLWGWALIYRLYQRYIGPAESQQAPTNEPASTTQDCSDNNSDRQ